MEQLTLGAAELGILAHMMRKVEFFSPLTVGQLEKVLPHVLLCSYQAGERVFKQGEPGDAFYIVYKGKVDIRLKKLVFFSKKVATLGEGNFFGETSLISAEPRNATVVCAEPTLLFTLLAGDFQFILEENPAAAREMQAIATQRKFVSSHAK